ncbi:PREDICTED: intraflagellar transport protein 22 homolog [Nicrophorus vespilloides]|uniref:Intraflagellar transport protein 22 homolog n=1 Tax=Nicrophorus vespilloides TaxID=110193 RepID=A0ABM1M9Z7_NICVS|nr:PREDICTED: intraflagellar transport protein 22 homolog [Nicrophorus vespilloides]
MKSNQLNVKILIIGTRNAGKSSIANFLADMSLEVPDSMRPTDSLRILEYDLHDVDVNGTKSNVDVQLWDTSGNEKCVSFWPFWRKNADGVVFAYSNEDEDYGKKLDYMHNYFVSQQGLSLRACLVCTLNSPADNSAKLPQVFNKISQINVNLENNAEKFRQEFAKYIVSVANNLTNK